MTEYIYRLKVCFSDLPTITPSQARKLDVELQKDLYHRFYEQPDDDFDQVLAYFKKESEDAKFEDKINYGIKDKLLISVEPNEWTHITNVYSDKQIRGQHLAKDLMQKILNKYKKCWLTVLSTNTQAIKFYESLGFKVFNTKTYTYDDGNTDTLYRMYYSENEDLTGLKQAIKSNDQ